MLASLRRVAGLVIACGFAIGTSQVLAEDSVEGQFLSNIRQVTSGFVKAGEGYFSPDGKQVVYQVISKD